MKAVVPSFPAALTIKRNLPMVSSVSIAEMFQRRHDNVLAAIRKELAEEISLLKVKESEETNARGKAIPVFWLTEEQALVVMPFIGGRMAREGQRKLVRAYLWYRDNYANPPRRDLIAAKRAAHHPMMDTLIEIREEAGKATRAHHFINENLLCNEIALGIRSAIDERTLSNEDAEVLRLIRERNSALLVADVAYAERKARLRLYLDRLKARALMGADRAAANGSIGEGDEQGKLGSEDSTEAPNA